MSVCHQLVQLMSRVMKDRRNEHSLYLKFWRSDVKQGRLQKKNNLPNISFKVQSPTLQNIYIFLLIKSWAQREKELKTSHVFIKNAD